MAVIYITSHKGKLVKNSETLQYICYDGTTTTIFPFKTEQLIILGEMSISGGALRLLMKYKIETVFLSSNGQYNSKLVFQDGKNILIRKKQFLLTEEKDKVLDFARSIVTGKVKNQLAFIKRISRAANPRLSLSVEMKNKTVTAIDTQLHKIPTTTSVDSLRGVEGVCARNYFSVFKYNIIQDWAVFNGRSRNPPEDNVNAVLSFLYTLLYYRVDSAIVSAGLDPFAGMFHVMDYGKHSLAFDLMEEFRVPLCDTTTCALFNLGILDKADFRTIEFSDSGFEVTVDGDQSTETEAVNPDKKGVLLTQKGISKVVTQFEKKLDTKLFYEPLQKQLSYGRIINEQSLHFKRFVTGEEVAYKPLIIK